MLFTQGHLLFMEGNLAVLILLMARKGLCIPEAIKLFSYSVEHEIYFSYSWHFNIYKQDKYSILQF